MPPAVVTITLHFCASSAAIIDAAGLASSITTGMRRPARSATHCKAFKASETYLWSSSSTCCRSSPLGREDVLNAVNRPEAQPLSREPFITEFPSFGLYRLEADSPS